MVCPFGCVCHAVCAPGVKWTLLALSREGPDGAATESTYTAPVNHSLGPAMVSMLFLVICMFLLLVFLLRNGLPARPPFPRLELSRLGYARPRTSSPARAPGGEPGPDPH